MKITKYGHACMVLEEQGKKLVIDPGVYSTDLPVLTDVAAVVFTHVHGDHYGPELFAQILKDNPGAQAYGTHEVSAAAQKTGLAVTPVDAGQSVETTPFQCTFFGGQHAFIFKDHPKCENVGVLINGIFYYPGDSFDMPGDLHPAVLALPVSGPWLKIGESMEFLEKVAPTKLCIPTHDAMVSEIGKSNYEKTLADISQESGATLYKLKSSESVVA